MSLSVLPAGMFLQGNLEIQMYQPACSNLHQNSVLYMSYTKAKFNFPD
ncbi:hypothetical protein COLO4_30716 [Corchorus olitorius]|uniref:Uncharacterized protein n=1 Tax=Corchorus olitorius TaxID=93759 RepID=A0A1R3H751_9ROSI|nr:hypothetical protein COLO4_30716 [Corchorus olitorius]